MWQRSSSHLGRASLFPLWLAMKLFEAAAGFAQDVASKGFATETGRHGSSANHLICRTCKHTYPETGLLFPHCNSCGSLLEPADSSWRTVKGACAFTPRYVTWLEKFQGPHGSSLWSACAPRRTSWCEATRGGAEANDF